MTLRRLYRPRRSVHDCRLAVRFVCLAWSMVPPADPLDFFAEAEGAVPAQA